MKKSNKIMTIVLSMLLMISGFFAMPFKKASADDPEVYTSFYYFSDNPDCTTYYNGFMGAILDDYNMPTANRYLYNWSGNGVDYYKGRLNSYFNSSAYVTISNAFIVFEISAGFPKQDPSEEIIIPAVLNSIFTSMHNQGCKIMFICDSDESTFSLNNYNAFLSKVDIHINTDLVTLIADYLINRMEENADFDEYDRLDFTGTTFIIHQNAKKIFLKYIVPYLEDKCNIPHNSILDNDDYNAIEAQIAWISEELYFNHRINVFVRHEGAEIPYYTNGNYYSDNDANVYYYLDEALSDVGEDANHSIDPQKTYAIGAVYSNTSDAKQDIDMWAFDLEEIESPVAFPVCVHNVTNATIDSLTDFILEAGVTKYYFYNEENENPVISEDGSESTYGSFMAIFSDFINGENLSIYDNMLGLCPITHKTIVISSYGWLPINISARNCWNLYADL